MNPRILLVNPPISDVAAFDLWARPLGLFLWAQRLRDWNFDVALIDATDRRHPRLPAMPPERSDGRGHYYWEHWPERPEPARIAHRRFKRYGLPPEAFEQAIDDAVRELGGKPDMVLMTTRMTYWYHAAAETARTIRRSLGPEVPLIVGGIYATLLPDHARRSLQPDALLDGPALTSLPRLLHERFGRPEARPLSPHIADWPLPAYDLMHDHTALPVLSSIGCPGHCSYCAARTLWDGGFHRLDPVTAARRVVQLHEQFSTRHFAFYDDALMARAEAWFDAFLDALLARKADVCFHLPNGIYYDALTPGRAARMRAAGFRTIRLSLESVRPDRLKAYRRQGSNAAFREAVWALRGAGYDRSAIGAYILAGTPGQQADEVREAIDFTHDCGAHVRLCEYSPIPGTTDWQAALKASQGEIEREPLWQNNNLYFHRPEAPIGPEAFEQLKQQARESR